MLVSTYMPLTGSLFFQGVSHSRPNSTDISLCYANRSQPSSTWVSIVSIRMPGEIGEDRRSSGALDLHPCFYLGTLKLGLCNWLNQKQIDIS